MTFRTRRWAFFVALPLVLAACSSADVGTEGASQSPTAPPVTSTPSTAAPPTGTNAPPITSTPSTAAPPTGTNAPPVLTGTPAATVVAGQAYSFRPAASDPENATLTFGIQNRPAWAVFSAGTGQLSGTPSASQVGSFAGITISVTDGTNTVSLPAFTLAVTAAPAGATNRAPTIAGTPATATAVGQAYSFQPSGADADGDALAYGIANKPAWATFSTTTGRLSGTPGAADVGTTANVVISVSDGKSNATLPAFTLAVRSATVASTTLTWEIPTLNDDASPLTTLTGFRIVYGNSSASLDRTIEVANPSVTSHVVENLSPGTWYFAVKAYNAAGVESLLSGVALAVIP